MIRSFAIFTDGEAVVHRRRVLNEPLHEWAVAGKSLTQVIFEGQFVASEKILDGQYFEVVARRARLEAERDATDDLVFDEVIVERARTDEEVAELMEGQRRLFTARAESLARTADQLERRKGQIGSQIEGIDSQRASLGTQLELIERELAKSELGRERLAREKARLDEAYYRITRGEVEGERTDGDGRPRGEANDAGIPNPHAAEFLRRGEDQVQRAGRLRPPLRGESEDEATSAAKEAELARGRANIARGLDRNGTP